MSEHNADSEEVDSPEIALKHTIDIEDLHAYYAAQGDALRTTESAIGLQGVRNVSVGLESLSATAGGIANEVAASVLGTLHVGHEHPRRLMSRSVAADVLATREALTSAVGKVSQVSTRLSMDLPRVSDTPLATSMRQFEHVTAQLKNSLLGQDCSIRVAPEHLAIHSGIAGPIGPKASEWPSPSLTAVGALQRAIAPSISAVSGIEQMRILNTPKRLAEQMGLSASLFPERKPGPARQYSSNAERQRAYRERQQLLAELEAEESEDLTGVVYELQAAVLAAKKYGDPLAQQIHAKEPADTMRALIAHFQAIVEE